MAGPIWTCYARDYCFSVLHNQQPRRFHPLPPIPLPLTKSAEESNYETHVRYIFRYGF